MQSENGRHTFYEIEIYSILFYIMFFIISVDYILQLLYICICTYSSNKSTFSSSFKFIAKWRARKESSSLYILPRAPPLTCIQSSSISILYQSSALQPLSHQQHFHPAKPVVYSKVHSLGFD